MGEASTEGPGGWVDRHGDALYRYAILRLRSPDLAADAVQETFLEAIRNRAAFAGRSTERTWLVGILKHKVADHFRKAFRTPTVDLPDEGNGEFDRRGHWRSGPGPWPGDPSLAAESGEFRAALARCLARLPRGLADAFLLRELEGLDSDEVGARLGITPANLWARLHRARSALRRCLEENGFGGGGHPDPEAPARTEKGIPRP